MSETVEQPAGERPESRERVQDALAEITALLRRHRLVEGLVHEQREHADLEEPKGELVESIVTRQNKAELQRRLDRLHPADIAYILEALPLDERLYIWHLVRASRDGDMDRLRSLLADDVTACTDGGGKVPASPYPLIGIAKVMERHRLLAREFVQAPSLLIHYAVIDGLPGFVTVEGGGIVQTTALQIEREKITAIYITRNPDELQHLAGVGAHEICRGTPAAEAEGSIFT